MGGDKLRRLGLPWRRVAQWAQLGLGSKASIPFLSVSAMLADLGQVHFVSPFLILLT